MRMLSLILSGLLLAGGCTRYTVMTSPIGLDTERFELILADDAYGKGHLFHCPLKGEDRSIDFERLSSTRTVVRCDLSEGDHTLWTEDSQDRSNQIDVEIEEGTVTTLQLLGGHVFGYQGETHSLLVAAYLTADVIVSIFGALFISALFHQ